MSDEPEFETDDSVGDEGKFRWNDDDIEIVLPDGSTMRMDLWLEEQEKRRRGELED